MTKKEKKAAYDKKRNEEEKEKLSAQNKARYKAKKDGLYTVYYLINEDYVGQTSNLWNRLKAHKNDKGRDVSNVHIIGKYKTREQAKEIEAGYHARGYSGYYRGN